MAEKYQPTMKFGFLIFKWGSGIAILDENINGDEKYQRKKKETGNNDIGIEDENEQEIEKN